MRRTLAMLIVLGCAATGAAQDRRPARSDLRRDTASASQGVAPEIWFYQQERARHDDAHQAVRRKAETRAGQRQARKQSMKWYGLSNTRPVATPTPLFGNYVPGWGSNSSDPQRWRPSPARVAQQSAATVY